MLSEKTNLTGQRIGQYLIDWAAFIIPAYVLMFVWIATFSDTPLAALGMLLPFAGIAGFIWNYVVRPVQSGTGQTLGMQLLKIKIVTEDGSPLTMTTTGLRGILLIVDGFFFGIVGIYFMSSERLHQRLGDKIAKTVVVPVEVSAAEVAAAVASAAVAPQAPQYGAPAQGYFAQPVTPAGQYPQAPAAPVQPVSQAYAPQAPQAPQYPQAPYRAN